MAHRLTLAFGAYDRTAAIADGRVRVEGTDLTCILLPVEEIFYRMARNREFDAAEMSLSSYTLTLERDQSLIAIPVFPSRCFRHNSIYVNAASGVERPEDLVGRRVGVPEYQLTAVVWIRGFLEDHHGVPVESVHYRTGGLHEAGRPEKLPIEIPGVDIQQIPEDRTLSEMLVSGEIDAVYTPRVPRPIAEGNPAVRRLWQDPRPVEAAYYDKTKIFPIMHTIVLRRDVYERDRWLTGSLFKAFVQAKRIADDALEETAALANQLPWGYLEAGATRQLMGEDFWPYGVEPNKHVLETFLGYLRRQGLIHTDLSAGQLFAPETHDTYLV